ncbi:Fanconi anemia group F protein [Trichosurus vulpecula]|uniref:Fanconi anemia group F protein n=1 Tax=Trichosurus vulpecula TaxID=9337 RepID=UPI00186B552A|nr:Fanconi anemia group F protein [Trichosurus vulpecula]
MERLLEQLERFAEVLAVSRTRHAGSWGRVAVRRSLRWARYLRHVHGRFRRRGPVRAALEEGLRRLQPRPGPDGHAGPCSGPEPASLRSFEGLGCGDQLLALGLLENAALQGPALHELLRHLRPEELEDPEDPEDEAGLPGRLAELARRRAASQLLLPLLGPDPARAEPVLRRTEAELLLLRLREEARAEAGADALLLDRLWVQLPRPRWLDVVAEALLLQPTPRPDGDEDEEDPGSQSDLGPSAATPLLAWLLARPAPLAALCRLLPAPLLASVADRHPLLAEACLDLLSGWGCCLHFDLVRGTWVEADPEGPTWERLRDCFRCFCQSPAPLRNQARTVLDTRRAQDGGFEAPGLSVWTDLLQYIGGEEPPGRGEDAETPGEMPQIPHLGSRP